MLPAVRQATEEWQTEADDFVEGQNDLHRELEEAASMDLSKASPAVQMARAYRDATEAREKLNQLYPIDNDPRFPGKRIYTNGHLYWDITGAPAEVWAIALSKNTDSTTFEKPPNSNHFSVTKAMRPSHNKSATITNAFPDAQALVPSVSNAPSNDYASLMLAQSAHSSQMLMLMMTQQLKDRAGPLGPASNNRPPTPPARRALTPTSSPNLPALPNVMIKDFCLEFQISERDQEKLEILEYRPS
ncbi:hypothetical protein DL96DRAFT_1564918 [Flagelloscypha sp. PMI_526]|nr:hypothetical protein DL96DRAFT_1564918 [Flagelloscypha sp. PMI_526]